MGGRNLTAAVEHEVEVRKRAHIHETISVGDHLADKAAATIGSWKFVICQSVATGLWIILNSVVAITGHWDPYPWILLNLCYSFQAGFTGPILLLAQNRQERKDRQRDDRDDAEIGEILDIARTLHAMQQEQMSHHKLEVNILRQLSGRGRKRGI